MLTDQSEWCC